MADENTEQTPTPAKARGAKQQLVARLVSAGADDTFTVGDLTVTPAGVAVTQQQAEELVEVAAQNGVGISVSLEDEGNQA